MKRTLLKLCACFLILFLFEGKIFAQEFGARVGTSFSSFANDYRFEGAGPGLVLGGFVNIPLSDVMQVTGGIDYQQLKGSVQNSPAFVGSDIRLKESNITFHTVEASALLGYKLPLGFLGDAAPYLQGGVSIAYNAGMWDHYKATYISLTGTPSDNSPKTFRGKENVSSLGDQWLPAWNVGLRFEVPLEDSGLFKKMFFDFRMRNSIDPALNVFPLNGSAKELGIHSLSTSIAFSF